MERLKLFLIGHLGAWVLRILFLTIRIRCEGTEREEEIRGSGASIIYAFWHGRMLLPAYSHRNRRIHVMASLSKDGEIISRVLERLGFRAVRGSSSRKGARALVEMARAGKAGFDTAVTPDGPRGPRYRVQRGVTSLARLTGFPILPAGLEASRYWQLRTWDEFRIPKPFSRAAIVLGEPLVVPRDASDALEDELGRELERRILAVSERASALARGESAA